MVLFVLLHEAKAV